MSEEYRTIPVSRTVVATRAHADITAGVNKHGDLVLILSPGFFNKCPCLSVGGKASVAYNPETACLRIAPAADGRTSHLRTIRARSGFAGAGTLVISAANLPETLPRPEKRMPVFWSADDDGAAVLDLKGV